jgi:hypothetical protein
MIGSFRVFYILIVIASLHSLTAVAEPPVEVGNKAYWLCKNKKEVRTIRVHIDEKTGMCATIYSRDGAEKTVGSGKNQESCIGFMNNVKTNLEKSNWSCRDISSTKISASLE